MLSSRGVPFKLEEGLILRGNDNAERLTLTNESRLVLWEEDGASQACTWTGREVCPHCGYSSVAVVNGWYLQDHTGNTVS